MLTTFGTWVGTLFWELLYQGIVYSGLCWDPSVWFGQTDVSFGSQGGTGIVGELQGRNP